MAVAREIVRAGAAVVRAGAGRRTTWARRPCAARSRRGASSAAAPGQVGGYAFWLSPRISI